MHISYVEIANFRKLLSVRVNLASDKTVFVGANNSGKTSAMTALRQFLIENDRFSIHDFTLCHWTSINGLVKRWSEPEYKDSGSEWDAYLPFLDVWLSASPDELHYVRHLVPTLDWNGGLLGVRIRLEPKEPEKLRAEYLAALTAANEIKALASETASQNSETPSGTDVSTIEEVVSETLAKTVEQISEAAPDFEMWPRNMIDFLSRKLASYFDVRAYLLDPAKVVPPEDGIARPQQLMPESVPLERDPFDGLIRIDEINAQRGFGQPAAREKEGTDSAGSVSRSGRKLSDQLRAYYSKHLDPFDKPEPSDLSALRAIDQAQKAFNVRLRQSFDNPLKEVESLGYPGVTDPKLTISTVIKPTDGLNHDSAVEYDVGAPSNPGVITDLRLPEDSNGLGYQNLISMIFRLMSFRDAWMKVGKAGIRLAETTEAFLPPLHLVLVEEPEAHLHAQVQQVFIQQAYQVLRNHPLLGAANDLCTQLVVSTHSSHIAHECEFSTLRYFRRLPASGNTAVPTTSVVDVSDVFGVSDETKRFVSRYIKATHCDLFFADAVILVEGPAERILVPHFIREKYKFLTQCYISLLEVGGSHAHRLRPLLEKLGLISLIITDIDSKNVANATVRPQRAQALTTRNKTLETWLPGKISLDELFDLPAADKTKNYNGFSIRAAYQTPVTVQFPANANPAENIGEALPNTFEDAMVYQNLTLFSGMAGGGLIGKFREAISSSGSLDELGNKLFEALKSGTKAEFALDIIELESLEPFIVPAYIAEGLEWLQVQLERKHLKLNAAAKADAETAVVELTSPASAENAQ